MIESILLFTGEFGALLLIRRPTLRAVDAAGAARGLGAIYTAVPCPRSYRSMEVASGATDALRWAARIP